MLLLLRRTTTADIHAVLLFFLRPHKRANHVADRQPHVLSHRFEAAVFFFTYPERDESRSFCHSSMCSRLERIVKRYLCAFSYATTKIPISVHKIAPLKPGKHCSESGGAQHDAERLVAEGRLVFGHG
jgi:hypothetical protein